MEEKATKKLHNTAMAGMFFGSDLEPDKIPWRASSKGLDFTKYEHFKNTIRDCRFYYRYDSFGGTVVDRMVDLSINDLIVVPDPKSTPTEIETFNAVKKDLLEFLKLCAMEYLTTGLVVPDVTFARLTSDALRDKKISRLPSLMYPTELSLKNSAMIEIRDPILGSKQSYFLRISDEMRAFIQNGGVYPDQTKDIDLYNRLATLFPELVKQIKAGNDKILIEDELIIRGKTLKDSPYPIPYMARALEAMQHKRNLRKADYSVAARVINAILHVKIGDKDFPLTEDQGALVQDLQAKLKYNKTLSNDDLERVFALFTNHVVSLEWVFPNVEALLDGAKFDSINEDILISLGFPRILLTGETQRSFSSDPNMATLAPTETMRRIRDVLMKIIDKVYMELHNLNSAIKTVPEVEFAPISLLSLDNFYEGIKELYQAGNLSRRSYTESFGFVYNEELDRMELEEAELEKRGLDEFKPLPHSNVPGEGETGAKKAKKAPSGGKNE